MSQAERALASIHSLVKAVFLIHTQIFVEKPGLSLWLWYGVHVPADLSAPHTHTSQSY